MINIRQILVTTDCGECSKAAMRRATELAEAFHARLDVRRVVEEPYGHVGVIHGFLPKVDALRESLNNAAQAQLQQVLTTDEVH